MNKVYVAIDLKSFYASCECIELGLDPLNTNLVVADQSRSEKTICLAVSPELISLLRLSMLRQRIRGANATSLTTASVGGISITLLRDALNIIGVNILNWYGAVIAQSGRQFDESGVDFLVVFRYNDVISAIT